MFVLQVEVHDLGLARDVLLINFRDFYDKFFGERPNQKPKGGMGSGFVIDKEGHILTNYHVVEGADEITVLLEANGNEKEYTATLIGSDEKTDIALIKINADPNKPEEFPFLRFRKL